jgi:hypothetical protein
MTIQKELRRLLKFFSDIYPMSLLPVLNRKAAVLKQLLEVKKGNPA